MPPAGQLALYSGGGGLGLGSLRLSELLNRARSLGVPQDVLDELMDGADPKNELIEMLNERSRSRPAPRYASSPEHDIEELVGSLARGSAADPVAVLKMMVSMCDSGLPVETQPGGDKETTVQLELAAAGATGVIPHLIQGVPDAEEYDRLVQPAVSAITTIVRLAFSQGETKRRTLIRCPRSLVADTCLGHPRGQLRDAGLVCWHGRHCHRHRHLRPALLPRPACCSEDRHIDPALSFLPALARV